jgi:hypothetical protein
MPVYTGGFLTPVPFLYAAVKLRHPRLWLIAAAYGAAWVVLRVLSALGPQSRVLGALGDALTLALALGVATHAFMLRASLAHRSGAPFGTAGQQHRTTPMTSSVGDPTQIMCAQVRAAHVSVTSSVRTHGDLFPSECTTLFDQTVALMEQVVGFVARGGHADAELRLVHTIVTDYLPTSINTYVRLPREYALTQPNSAGRTASEELELELRLFRDEVKEAVDSLHRTQALRLQEQTAFLRGKFGKSDLDIP